MHKIRIIWLTSITLALVLFILALSSYYERRHFQDYSSTALAKVIGHSQTPHQHSRIKVTSGYPLVTFVTENNQQVTIPLRVLSNTSSFLEGDEILIRYDPLNPQEAYLGRTSEIWGKPLSFVFFGIVLFFVPMVFSRMSNRGSQS